MAVRGPCSCLPLLGVCNLLWHHQALGVGRGNCLGEGPDSRSLNSQCCKRPKGEIRVLLGRSSLWVPGWQDLGDQVVRYLGASSD